LTPVKPLFISIWLHCYYCHCYIVEHVKAHSVTFSYPYFYCERQGQALAKPLYSRQPSMLNAGNSVYIYGCLYITRGVNSGKGSVKP
jgi:hypothetical protein